MLLSQVLYISFQLENGPFVSILFASKLALKFEVLLIILFDRQVQAVNYVLSLSVIGILFNLHTCCSLRTCHFALI